MQKDMHTSCLTQKYKKLVTSIIKIAKIKKRNGDDAS